MSDAPQPRPSDVKAPRESELSGPGSALTANVRWGVYLLLIAIAVGNMTGRLLSVNSVDKVQLEAARIKDRLAGARKQLIEEGVSGEQLESRMTVEEARLRNDLKLQRPFLSANDRSRWLTIRSLVERGTYEIDAIVGEPTWDTIDMVQHRGRDGELHLYSSKPPLLATLLAGEYWAINRFGERYVARQLLRNWSRDAVYREHSAAHSDVRVACPIGRTLRLHRLGPHLRDGRRHTRHIA